MTDILFRHVRLATLRLLSEQGDYSANASVIQDALDLFGLNISRDQVKGQLAWLKEQGLVELEELSPGIVVAKITGRGLDIAKGNITHPGVRRRRPTD